jgi:hypothetical protein
VLDLLAHQKLRRFVMKYVLPRQYSPGNPRGCWFSSFFLDLNAHSNVHGDFKVLAIGLGFAMPERQ